MVRQGLWGGVSSGGLTEEKNPLWKWGGPFPWVGDMIEWNKGGGLSQKNGCFSLACLTVDHTLHLPPQDSAYVHGATQLWTEPSETTRQDRRFFHSIFFSGIVILAMLKWLTGSLHSLGLWVRRVTKQPLAVEQHRAITSWGERISSFNLFLWSFTLPVLILYMWRNMQWERVRG